MLALGAAFLFASGCSTNALQVSGHGGFFIGGIPVTIAGAPARQRVSADPAHAPPLALNGDYVRGATYVEYTRLAHPLAAFPVVMVPGGGLSGASFQDTPDGRPGWESWFLWHGYSVDIVDIDRTGRSPWRAFPEIEASEPSFRNNAFLWETFRIGPPGSYASAHAFVDTQFPLGAFAELASQAAPRFHPAADEQAAAYDAVIRRLCPCILLLHSASGPPGMAAAQRWPRLVKAVVAVEPSGAPERGPMASPIPHIFIWGDHLGPAEADPSWQEEYREAQAYRNRLGAAGAATRWIDLPAMHVRGNSHLLMMDRNSDQIAAMIDQALGQLLGASKESIR